MSLSHCLKARAAILSAASFASDGGPVSLADLAVMTPLPPTEIVEILSRSGNTRLALQDLLTASADYYHRSSPSPEAAERQIKRCVSAWVHATAVVDKSAQVDRYLGPWFRGKPPQYGPANAIVSKPPPKEPTTPRAQSPAERELSKVLDGTTKFRPGGLVWKEAYAIPDADPGSLRIEGSDVTVRLRSGETARFKTSLTESELKRLAMAVVEWKGLVLTQNNGEGGQSVTFSHPAPAGTSLLEVLSLTDTFTGELFYGKRYGDGSRYLPLVGNVPNAIDDLIDSANRGNADDCWVAFLEYFSRFDCNPATFMGPARARVERGEIRIDGDVLQITFAPGVSSTSGNQSLRNADAKSMVSQEEAARAHRAIVEFNKEPKRFQREVPSLASTIEVAKIVGLFLASRDSFNLDDLKSEVQPLGSPPEIKYLRTGSFHDPLLESCADGELTEVGRKTFIRQAFRLAEPQIAKQVSPDWLLLDLLVGIIGTPSEVKEYKAFRSKSQGG